MQFALEACCIDLIGIHGLKIKVESDLLVAGPQGLVEVYLHILPCRVDFFGFGIGQPFEDITIRVLDANEVFKYRSFV